MICASGAGAAASGFGASGAGAEAAADSNLANNACISDRTAIFNFF